MFFEVLGNNTLKRIKANARERYFWNATCWSVSDSLVDRDVVEMEGGIRAKDVEKFLVQHFFCFKFCPRSTPRKRFRTLVTTANSANPVKQQARRIFLLRSQQKATKMKGIRRFSFPRPKNHAPRSNQTDDVFFRSPRTCQIIFARWRPYYTYIVPSKEECPSALPPKKNAIWQAETIPVQPTLLPTKIHVRWGWYLVWIY